MIERSQRMVQGEVSYTLGFKADRSARDGERINLDSTRALPRHKIQLMWEQVMLVAHTEGPPSQLYADALEKGVNKMRTRRVYLRSLSIFIESS